uniref:Uncharacterized protein n=1 Tax=Anopheles arabiensis TaxID=7173 RepID=A0A182HGI6_ANOAR
MVYPEEYRILHKARDNAEPTLFVHRSSPLRKRSPYMDRDGVLRVKGRIDACSFISEDTKRPVILPKANFVTDLIIDFYHRKYRHANHLVLINEVRQRYEVSAESIKNTWKTSQVYADIFWRKWVSCYLPTLTKRTKWFDTVKPITVGDVVLIVDETLPRRCWPKGRVVRAIVSRDGAVRRVHVQTASGKIIERPAVKIAVIDVSA